MECWRCNRVLPPPGIRSFHRSHSGRRADAAGRHRRLQLPQSICLPALQSLGETRHHVERSLFGGTCRYSDGTVSRILQAQGGRDRLRHHVWTSLWLLEHVCRVRYWRTPERGAHRLWPGLYKSLHRAGVGSGATPSWSFDR